MEKSGLLAAGSLLDWNEWATFFTDIDLSGPADPPIGIVPHLFPVGDPAGQAAQGEHDGEHVGGNTDGPVDDAAVEIHVGVEVSLDKVAVV